MILKALLGNEGFKRQFVNRHADLLNTLFVPGPMIKAFDSLVALLDPAMPRHVQQWGSGFHNPLWGVEGRNSYDQWRNTEMPKIRDFLQGRTELVREQLQAELGLGEQMELVLDVFPPGNK